MSLSISESLRSFPRPPSGRLKAEPEHFKVPLEATGIEQQFLEIARKSPIERMRDKIMEDMKLSDDSLAAMDSESRQAVEDEIKRRMMEALEASTETGQLVDKSA